MNTSYKNCIDVERQPKQDTSRLDRYETFAIENITRERMSALQTYKYDFDSKSNETTQSGVNYYFYFGSLINVSIICQHADNTTILSFAFTS